MLVNQCLAPGALATILLLTPMLPAQGDAAAGGESFEAIRTEYSQAMESWNAAYRSAIDDGDQDLVRKLRGERPQASAYAARVEKVIATDPKADASGAAAAWLISPARVQGALLERAVGVLAEHHAGSAHVESVLMTLTRNPAPVVTRFLEQQQQACEGERRALACMATAEHLKYTAETIRRIQALAPEDRDNHVTFLGKDVFDALHAADADAYEQRAIAGYERVLGSEAMAAVEYRGRELGQTAKASLFELQNLSIGKTAPDIVGEDIDGVPMKLSDYRGKVVVLDFWGDW